MNIPFGGAKGGVVCNPKTALPRRAREDDPPLHDRDHQRDRPGEGHPGSGRGHGRARDGLDLRHVLDEQGALGARRRHRQAAERRRVARPARGDCARRDVLDSRGDRASSSRRRPARRRPGFRQRRPLPLEVPRGGGREGDRDLGFPARVYNPNGIDIEAAIAHKQETGALAGLRGTEPIRTRTSCCSTATCSHPARSSR